MATFCRFMKMPTCVIAVSMVSTLMVLLPVAAQTFDEVHACDTFAAHPDDPNRWRGGVPDSDMAPAPAIKFCAEAAAAYPDVPRFRFQLGRAYWAAQRHEEAVAVFLDLEESADYPPVYAYLGDAFYFGLGGLPEDHETALILYQAAAEGGFAPAEAAIDALAEAGQTPPAEAPSAPQQGAAQAEPQAGAPTGQPAAPVAPQPQTTAPVEPPLNLSGFAQPGMIGALVSGNLSAMTLTGIGKTNYVGLDNRLIYLMSLNTALGSACVELFDPAFDQALRSKVQNLVTGGGGGSFEQQYNRMADQGLMMLGAMLTDMSQNGLSGMMQMESDMQALTDSAAKDAAVLLRSLGCSHSVIMRVHQNIKAHVRGDAPALSPDQVAKAEEAKAKAVAERAKAEREKVRAAARASCERSYPGRAFCGCVIQELDRIGAEDAVWSSLQKDFGALLAIAAERPQVVELVRTCRKNG